MSNEAHVNGQAVLSPGSRLMLLVLVSAGLVFFELGRMDIADINEAQRATPAMEMLRSGDWVIPTINGSTYLAKPPLLYWLIAGVYSLTGTLSPLTARVPTALCGVGLVLALYGFVKRSDARAAFWAACITIAAPYVLRRARLAQLDVPLTLAAFLAILALVAAVRANGSLRCAGAALLSGAALGAAVMLKGPAPLLFVVAAWAAAETLQGAEPERALHYGLRLSVLALLLELLLKGLAWLVALIAERSGGAESLTPVVKTLSMPFALVLLLAGWAFLAIRFRRGGLLRCIGVPLAALGVAGALAAPWAVLVLKRQGWPYICALLQDQVIERTHTASEINSGSPLFYFIALPVLLAPWGFLLPLHASGREWNRHGFTYRFSLVTGWLSVLLFSLVAGKEYEYILPAIPFLLVPAGYHIAGELTGWARRYFEWFVPVGFALVLAAAVGIPAYALVEEPRPVLLAETAVIAVAALVLAGLAWRRPKVRVPTLYAVSAMAVLSGLLVQAHHYNGENSPKTIARTAANLVRSGKTVEAAVVDPQFAFYARTLIPVETDPAKVRERFFAASGQPYYYVVPEKYLVLSGLVDKGGGPQPLMGPHASRGLVLVGNAPLSEASLPPERDGRDGQ